MGNLFLTWVAARDARASKKDFVVVVYLRTWDWSIHPFLVYQTPTPTSWFKIQNLFVFRPPLNICTF